MTCHCPESPTPHRHTVIPLILASVFVALCILVFTASASRSAAQQDTPVVTDGSERRAKVPNLGAGSPEVVGASGAGRGDLPAGPVDVLGAMVRAERDQVTRDGVISHMGSYPVPDDYLALPCKRGNVHCGLLVELCAVECVVLRQTDYGPSQRVHPDRIADVSPRMFERVCGVPASYGLCAGSWTAIEAPRLPETAKEEE